ncbi:hypothetical protein Tco_1277339 [Tanacetum coccineum]
MLRTCYGHNLTKGTIIQIFYHGLDDPKQGILDVGGIFLYNTPNKAFKILEDKVLLKINILKDPHISPKPNTIVSSVGKNVNPDHAILMEIKKSTSDYQELGEGDVKLIEEDETQPILTMPNLNPINSNSPTVSPFLKDSTVHIPYTNAKTFADDVLLNHIGDEELKSFDGVGTGRMTEKEKNDKAGNDGGGCLEAKSIDLTSLF